MRGSTVMENIDGSVYLFGGLGNKVHKDFYRLDTSIDLY